MSAKEPKKTKPLGPGEKLVPIRFSADLVRAVQAYCDTDEDRPFSTAVRILARRQLALMGLWKATAKPTAADDNEENSD